jgi:protein O-GlcNAc transferase
MSTAESMFHAALTALNGGRFAEAERLFRTVLKSTPRHVGALNLLAVALMSLERFAEAEEFVAKALKLHQGSAASFYNHGIILKRLGQPKRALERFDRALRLDPRNHEAWNNRGAVLNDLRHYERAIADFDQAIALSPGYYEALCNKGKSLDELGRQEEAFAAYGAALALRPDPAEAWLGHANLLRKLGRHDEAFAAYGKALALRPGLAEAWLGRGQALLDLRQHEDALVALDQALALRPDLPGAWNARGNALSERQRHDEALAAYEKVLAINPEVAEAWVGRGNVFRELGRHDQALAAYDKALTLRPDLAEGWLGRGNALAERKHLEAAIAAYEKALALKPELAEAWLGRGYALRELKRYAEALAAYDRALALKPDLPGAEGARLHARMLLCDWRDIAPDCAHLIAAMQSGKANATPFVFAALPATAEDQGACARAWVARKHPPAAKPTWRGEVHDHDRIRIAYVSADFHEHAIAYLAAGLFESHDRSRFEVTGISIGPDDTSAMRRRLTASFDRFVDARGLGDEAAADRIRDAEIDILVDLTGFTRNARTGIFAHRAAPIQVNYLGFPGTMGADYIDYIIADHTLIPRSERAAYAEKIVYLPDCYQINDDRRPISDTSFTRADMSLPEAAFVFCCFNNSYKILPDVFDGWMRLLQRIDGGVLWLFENNAGASANLRNEAAARGIDPGRLVFAKRLPAADHLARHRLADLFLDTLPYNAHTTASDALWSGLPVLTQVGSTFAGRVAASLLQAVGLPELIAASPQEYETRAIELASNPARLAEIRARLARNRMTAPLFDTKRTTRHIERAYEAMYDRHRAGLPPDHIDVAAAG